MNLLTYLERLRVLLDCYIIPSNDADIDKIKSRFTCIKSLAFCMVQPSL